MNDPVNNIERFKNCIKSQAWSSAFVLIPQIAHLYSKNAEVCSVFGDVCRRVGALSQSAIYYRNAVDLDRKNASRWRKLAQVYASMDEFFNAAIAFKMLCRLDPQDKMAQIMHFIMERAMCEWSASLDIETIEAALANRLPVSSLPLMFSFDDPALQHNCAKEFAHFLEVDTSPSERLTSSISTKRRLRVGYFSADMHAHATAYLIAGLLRHHDRAQFEIIIYSYGRIKDAWTDKIAGSADKFVDASAMGDPELTRLARKDKLDIAIDLKGYTQHARFGVFKEGIAPVQITYLGYPGSLASPCFDYAIVDETVIPEQEREHYTEKLIYLPDPYQCTDNERPVSDKPTTRADWGLPEEGTVFCCFNHSAKICPDVFSIWMNVLRRADAAVLWLLESNKWAKENLWREAEQRGINPDRIVFAPKVSQDEHLARLRHADLFLDTFAYNAHTTASDALYMGLPIVTKAGRQFAARVGASLLKAVGLPELVTETDSEYEALILDLAADPQRLTQIRDKLNRDRL